MNACQGRGTNRVTAVARDSSKNTAKLWENSSRLCEQSRVLQEAIRHTIAESKIAVAEARQAIAKIKTSRSVTSFASYQ
jgi:ABC-type transporter Mla subunit MlaD